VNKRFIYIYKILPGKKCSEKPKATFLAEKNLHGQSLGHAVAYKGMHDLFKHVIKLGI